MRGSLMMGHVGTVVLALRVRLAQPCLKFQVVPGVAQRGFASPSFARLSYGRRGAFR